MIFESKCILFFGENVNTDYKMPTVLFRHQCENLWVNRPSFVLTDQHREHWLMHTSVVECAHSVVDDGNICRRSHHDDVIKWKHFRRCWPFVRGIPWSPVNTPHKGQWRGALMFSFNNREAGNLGRHRGHCDVIVMISHYGMFIRCVRQLFIATWRPHGQLRVCINLTLKLGMPLSFIITVTLH